MKTCPVCKSLCFDDMPVCYGCMHDFERDVLDDPEEAVPPSPASSGVQSFGSSGSAAPSDEGMRSVMSLPIPMITSTFAQGRRSDVTANLASRKQGCAPRPNDLAHSGKASHADASPWLTFETPGGCRLVLHLEPA